MFESSFPKSFYDFIEANKNLKPSDAIIKYSGKELDFDLKFAVTQIESRKKGEKKIPGFLSSNLFLFSDSLAIEQATDERVARFHASLVGGGKNVVDLTAGLGIDAMTFANRNNVTAVELNTKKAETLEHNASILSISNLKVINEDCVKYIKDHIDSLDCDFFFIDPARRDDCNRRTYSFKDCQPDITSFYKDLIKNDARLFIKASPLLDITAVMREFENIRGIYIVSVKNEVKEVLVEIGGLWSASNGNPAITVVDLDDNGVVWKFKISSEKEEYYVPYAEDLDGTPWLYEPGAALMKLHAAGKLCEEFKGLRKLAPNTELYISEQYYGSFPGRKFRLIEEIRSKDFKRIKGSGFSVVARNYPITADEIRKKGKFKEDPDNFLFAFKYGRKETPIMVKGLREK